jgi:muconolactone delta-isomerase
MNSALRSRAEVMKLARLLDREPEQLEYLEAVPPEDLRVFREEVTDMLFTAHDGTFERLAAASKLLPAGLVAMLAQHAFGPMLSARITGLLDPGRAVDVAAKLPPEFLADIAVDLDPRRASDVIARMPAEQTQRVTRELVRRGEYVTMGRFVGHLSNDSLQAAIGEIDDATLLRTAFVLEERDRLDALAELVGEDRVAALAEAAERDGLWPEAIDLLMNLDRGRVAEGLARLDPGKRELLEARAREEGVELPAAASEGAAS